MKNLNELSATHPELAVRMEKVYNEIEDLIATMSEPGEATKIKHLWSFKLFQCKKALDGARITTRPKKGS